MDPITQQTVLAAAGAAGGDPVYVDDVFSTFLYEGTGTTKTITNGIDLAGEGGLVWIKNRDVAWEPALFDTERGVQKMLQSSHTGAQYDRIASGDNDTLSSFNNNGFTVETLGTVNANGNDYVSWTFRKAPGFFDVVTYTGSGSGTKTISHNLGSVPGMIIVKGTNSGSDWSVYHRSLNGGSSPEDYYLRLNGSDAESNAVANWGGTAPTATEFTVGGNANVGINYVAYIFAHDDAQYGTDGDESIIKCGSYTGTLSEQFIDLGFEPQFLLHKRTDGSGSWTLFDNMRSWSSSAQARLFAESSEVEATASGDKTLTSTGFREPGVPTTSTWVYMAIRRPNKPPEAGTDVFAIDYGSGSSTIPTWDSGFPVDMALSKRTTDGDSFMPGRLIGSKQLKPTGSAAESNDSSLTWDSNVGWGKDYSSNYISYMFKRAPGFFDVVAYSGDGNSNRAVPHNLEVTPELLILKRRQSEHWFVQYTGVFGTNTALRLSTPGVASAESAFNSTSAATASNFYIGSDSSANGATGTYIVYLFATLPGISKVGSYTGTGSDMNIDCGFTNGARFVLIKRTDSTADWFLYDTTRGIATGNDPYFKLNQAEAQVTNTDYIDPLNAGFIANSNSADINTSGGTYLFLAIA